MDKKYVDLHVHTTASDGTFTPSQVVEKAKEFGFSAIAIADHDTTQGIAEAFKKGEELGIEIVPSIELSAYYNNLEMHVLGYYFNWQDGTFNEKLLALRDTRRERAVKIVEKLKTSGINLNINEILQNAGEDKAIGRPHIAQQLIKEGYCKDVSEVFEKYLGEGCVGYVPKPKLTPQQAFAVIKEYGGIPVIAHPMINNVNESLPELIKDGAMGIEVYHTEHTYKQSQYLWNFATKNNILITGGSDCHGLIKEDILMGKIKLPYSYLEKLKAAVQI